MIILNKSDYNGVINAPASKSYLQRALLLSALSFGKSKLNNISWCDDSLACKSIIEALGSEIIEKENNLYIKPHYPSIKSNIINVNESGLSARLIIPILALYSMEFHILGKGSILNRPLNMLAPLMEQMGVHFETNAGYLPICVRGAIKNNYIEVESNQSSQHLSGLLIAMPLAPFDSVIKVNSLKSLPYVEMTLSIIEAFGGEIGSNNFEEFTIKGNQTYKGCEYGIEGDWSGSAFHLVAGAIAGKVEISNLNINSKQGDKNIISILERVGADISINNNTILVKKNKLNSFEYDASDTPDLFPPLLALASACDGISVIKGISRLGNKESNRLQTLETTFSAMGIRIEIDSENDIMKIWGGQIKSAHLDSHNDHRIAMAIAVASLRCKGEILLNNQEVVSKSYPAFFDDFFNSKTNYKH